MRPARILATLLAFGVVVVAAPAHARIPSDPLWPEQWAQRVAGVPAAWTVTTGDPGIVIATVDTGVNADLPDLAGALAPGWDFVEDDAHPQDTHGHGTLVASVLAAQGNNGIGMAGYCWDCRVMPLRVAGTFGKADPETIAEAVRWAVDHGARIVNVSYAHPEPNEAEEAAVRYAIARGVIVVASAGNSGDAQLHYPAAYPGVLAAAGSDETDTLFSWSTRGSWVPITAPGCHVVIDYLGGQGTLCGTSFAPAAVSGVAALVLSRDPRLTADRAVEALLGSARRPVPGIAGGRIDAWAAFAWLGWLRSPQARGAPRWTVPAEAPAASRRLTRETVFERGALRRTRSLSIVIGRGVLDVRLTARGVDRCSLTLRGRSGVLLAPPARRGVISLATYVASGRHRFDIACPPARRRPYTLEITAMFP